MYIATHAGILTSASSTRPRDRASTDCRTLPYHGLIIDEHIRSFGGKLEPRYIFGAESLDQ